MMAENKHNCSGMPDTNLPAQWLANLYPEEEQSEMFGGGEGEGFG